jgi:hypothetical protein
LCIALRASEKAFWEDAMVKCDATDRYYLSEEFRANVLLVWRDREVEALAAVGPVTLGECDAEIAERVLEAYLFALHDGFREHPEFRAGVELRCENHQEAAYMANIMAQITQDTIPYQVTWVQEPSTLRQALPS